MKLHLSTERPETGRKFVAFFDDGSGAVLMYACDLGFIDAEGGDYSEERLTGNFSHWAYMPDDFEFNCELWEQDAFHLPRPKHTPTT